MTLREAITTGLRVGLNRRIPARDVLTLGLAGAAASAGAIYLTRWLARVQQDAVGLLEERASLEQSCDDLAQRLDVLRQEFRAHRAGVSDNGVPDDETLERVAEGLRHADAEPAAAE